MISTKIYVNVVQFVFGLAILLCLSELFIVTRIVDMMRFPETFTQSGMHNTVLALGINRVLIMISSLLGALAFGVFLYKAYLNLKLDGFTPLTYEPAMGFWSFLIPFVWYVLPLRIWKEVWLGLQFKADPDSVKKGLWFDGKAPILLTIWWISWCSSILFEIFALVLKSDWAMEYELLPLVLIVIAFLNRLVGFSLLFWMMKNYLELEKRAVSMATDSTYESLIE